MPRPCPPAATCLLTLLAVLLATTTPALAQYKWKDGRGQMHVSDLPPPRDIPDKDVLQRPAAARRGQATAAATVAPAASAVAAQRTPADPELEARRNRAELEAKARAKADEEQQAALRAGNCQRARQQLATLDSGQRMVRFNAQGERVVLDDAMRQDEAELARRAIASDCR